MTQKNQTKIFYLLKLRSTNLAVFAVKYMYVCIKNETKRKAIYLAVFKWNLPFSNLHFENSVFL